MSWWLERESRDLLPLNMRQSEAEWKATMSRMITYGAHKTHQEQEISVQYAAKHFGRRCSRELMHSPG